MSSYTYQQYIGGEWVEASNGATWDVLNPATEETIRAVPFGNADDANEAIGAAAQAASHWGYELTAYDRASFLKRAADIIRSRVSDLARTTTLESGKPITQSQVEWSVAADLLEWFAEEGKRAYGRVIPARQAPKRRLVLKQPLGVVGVITAWNFPIYNPARAVAAALAAGCTVVLRPSEFTPLSAIELVNILHETGIPAGAINLINGEPEAMGQAMLDHPAVRKISFTGSTRVGRILMEGAGRTFTRLGLELGGNAPVLVFPDTNLEQVVKGGVTAKFRNNGQVCTAPQRFIVHTQVIEEFMDRAVNEVKALRLGSGLDTHTDVGPMINARQRERLEDLIAAARDEGAEILTGGQRPAQFSKGYFYEPTVAAHLDSSSRLLQEEIFGPVMPIIPFTDPEEGLALANATQYGLAAYVFTNNLNDAIRAYERLEFGIVGVNDWYPWATEAPFAGWKQSGLGHESGMEGLQDYLETKLVTIGI